MKLGGVFACLKNSIPVGGQSIGSPDQMTTFGCNVKCLRTAGCNAFKVRELSMGASGQSECQMDTGKFLETNSTVVGSWSYGCVLQL